MLLFQLNVRFETLGVKRWCSRPDFQVYMVCKKIENRSNLRQALKTPSVKKTPQKTKASPPKFKALR